MKNISHVDTSSFALKTNLANLKTEVNKLDIGKLVPVPFDLSKLSNVVKKDVYNKLVTKVNSIDTSMVRINQNSKIKSLILVVLLKRLIMMLR